MIAAKAGEICIPRAGLRPRVDTPCETGDTAVLAGVPAVCPRTKALSFSSNLRSVEEAGLQCLANRLLFQITHTRDLIMTVEKLTKKPDQITKVVDAISRLQVSNRSIISDTDFQTK